MASNRKKEAATLYELLKKTGLKKAKQDGWTHRLASWFTARDQPASPAKTGAESPASSLNAGTTAKPRPAASGPSTAIRLPPAGIAPPQAMNPDATPLEENPILLDILAVRFRPWLLFAGAALTVVIIGVLIIWATRKSSSSGPVPSSPPVGSPTVEFRSHLATVPSYPIANRSPGNFAALGKAPPARRKSRRVGMGRVIPARQVPRLADHWYLVILTTLPQYARLDAEFIARHGVDTTVEPGPGRFAMVVSVRGFRHRAGRRAIAFRRKVVRIGTLLPAAKRIGHSLWSDAYYARVDAVH